MKLSVACNFDDALPAELAPYPVREVYGKLTADYFGGGRPSFYLPAVNRAKLERTATQYRKLGIGFNYLLNSSTMGNLEYTREGQKEMESLLEWLDGIGVHSVTVSSPYFLRLIKQRFPSIRVRISAHRYSDTPRKIRFWVDNGADCVVVSEVNIHREFKILESLKRAAGDVELQLIVNNWCRTDCAIAGVHAVNLSAASATNSKGYPLDYCSLVCNELRLREPVNYVRANWIRPEDLPVYEDLGYDSFKIVERNTPTPLLALRVRAYAERRYDGNLLDLVQNFAYPEAAFGAKAKDAYSLKRMARYFLAPHKVNLMAFRRLVNLGKEAGLLYPRRGANPVFIDNRGLDGFIDRFKKRGCQDLDCEDCSYCHRWAEKTVHIDAERGAELHRQFSEVLNDVDSGRFFEGHLVTLRRKTGEIAGAALAKAKAAVDSVTM